MASPWSVPFPTPPGSCLFLNHTVPRLPTRLTFWHAVGCYIGYRGDGNYLGPCAGISSDRQPGQRWEVSSNNRWVPWPPLHPRVVGCLCSPQRSLPTGRCLAPGKAQQHFYCSTALFCNSRKTPVSFKSLAGASGGGNPSGPFMATRHLMGADTGVSDSLSPAMLLLPSESRKKS